MRVLTPKMLVALETLGELDPDCDDFKNVVLVTLLGRMDPVKPKGPKLCNAFMRLWATPSFEAVAFRENGGELEVYMSRRASDDTAYPDEWHVPGAIYRASDEMDENVTQRLEQEFGVAIKDFELVDRMIVSEARGTVHSHIFHVQLAGNPRIDDRHRWYPVYDLPEVTVDHHRELIIPLATAAYYERSLRF